MIPSHEVYRIHLADCFSINRRIHLRGVGSRI
jgi:hypothetical protein